MIKLLRSEYVVEGDGTKEQNLFMRDPNTREQFPLEGAYPEAGEVRHIVAPSGWEDDVEFVDELPPEPPAEGGNVEFNIQETEINSGDGLV